MLPPIVPKVNYFFQIFALFLTCVGAKQIPPKKIADWPSSLQLDFIDLRRNFHLTGEIAISGQIALKIYSVKFI